MTHLLYWKYFQVRNIRTIQRQIVRLLTTNEQSDLNSEDTFKPFKDLDFLKYGPHTAQKWLTAKKQFEYLLQPAELTVASKLKKQLSGITNIRQVRNIFAKQKYNENMYFFFSYYTNMVVT